MGYVAGTITISAGQAGVPQNLLALIQQQLEPNCPGAAQEVTIQATVSNVYVGRYNAIGPLSTANFGYVLQAAFSGSVAGSSRTYRSSFPGHGSPVNDLQVVLTAAGSFQVEVVTG
jgi:hypothetical protein